MVSNVEVINLFKKRKKFVQLYNLNFTIQNKSVNVFVGENGAGKTTFMNILAGNDEDYNGEIKYNNQNVKKSDDKKILFFETNNKFPIHLNLMEYIKQYFLFFKDKQANENEINDVLKKFDLFERKNVNPNFLSSGQKKKLILAMSYLIKPDLLILDEPESNLDPTSRLILYKEIKSLTNYGITIFLSTHLISEIQDYVDYAIFLSKGKIIWNGKVTKQKNLNYLYKKYIINYEQNK